MDPITITNVIIYTVDKNDTVISNGTVKVHNGIIEYVGATEPEHQTITNEYVIDGKGRLVLIPGLIDTYSHSSLLRGYYEDVTLLEWFSEYELENQILTEDDAYDAALLGYIEAVKSGTTCLTDMFRYLYRCGDAAKKIGLRVNLVPTVATIPGKQYFETIETSMDLVESHHLAANSRIRVFLGLEHLLFCNPETYQWTVDYARDNHLGIYTQSNIQKEEVEEVVKKFGKRPIQILKERGILKPNTVIADCVWLDDDEIKLLADSGTGVAHCPVSNAKLGAGVAPLLKLRERGIKVGLGTGGPLMNNNRDMFEEMKFTALIQKAVLQNAKAITAAELLRMATIDGARLVGLDNEIGSIEVGKKADLVLVDLWKPNLQPITFDTPENSVLWNLIYSARADDVHTVLIDGEVIVAEGKMVSIDEEYTLGTIASQTKDFLSRRTRALKDVNFK